MNDRIARVMVTCELLVEQLPLPRGTKIICARVSTEIHDTLELFIEHEDLEPVAPGARIPTRDVICTVTQARFK